MKILAFILILILVGFLGYVSNKSYEDACKSFAETKGCTIVSSDTHLTSIGTPFYYVDEGTMIYEIKLSNGETWFMRPSLFGNDWEQKH